MFIVLVFCYPNWGFSVLFPQLYGKCQGIIRKDGARPALPNFSFLCIIFLSVLCVLLVCKCVMYCCHRVLTQLRLYIYIYIIIMSYHFSRCIKHCLSHSSDITWRWAQTTEQSGATNEHGHQHWRHWMSCPLIFNTPLSCLPLLCVQEVVGVNQLRWCSGSGSRKWSNSPLEPQTIVFPKNLYSYSHVICITNFPWTQ
jgi:hypothetical protein